VSCRPESNSEKPLVVAGEGLFYLRYHWANLGLLKASDQIKFDIASKRDFDWTAQTIRGRDLDRRFTVLLSAVFDSVTTQELANWLLETGLHVGLQ
jgi:7-carboxy-7-deazaguanine synthase